MTLRNVFNCSDIRQTHKCCPCKVAPEQKARLTYDNILRLSDDPDVNNVIRFLREREIVHFQRFGEPKRTGGIIPSTQIKSAAAKSYRAFSFFRHKMRGNRW